MGIDRRGFLKVSGLTAVGLASGSVAKVFGNETDPADSLTDSLGAHEALDHTIPENASRWAMVIDLRKCQEHEDCNDCSQACHVTHNVPAFDNRKDEVKWIWKESFAHTFHDQEHAHQRHDLGHAPTLVLCNHCDNPPCVKVCPTGATWKRKNDGIVMMDWHRCIGCRYCVAACPYGSRSFNWRDPRSHIAKINPQYPTRTRGVVEKCTFCEERVSRGKIPACVEACKYGALHFGDLDDPESNVRRLLQENFTLRRKPGLGTNPEVYYIV
ncbi:MAG: sulfate reduction electron transfer complex DsrMKJOP subunit DsrO [bacterium]